MLIEKLEKITSVYDELQDVEFQLMQINKMAHTLVNKNTTGIICFTVVDDDKQEEIEQDDTTRMFQEEDEFILRSFFSKPNKERKDEYMESYTFVPKDTASDQKVMLRCFAVIAERLQKRKTYLINLLTKKYGIV